MENLAACPWSTFRPGELQFCEANLCAWVVAPAETWSNVSYFVAAAFLVREANGRSGETNGRLSREFAFAATMVGIFSTFYHASHIWWLETLDLGSMFFLVALMIRENLRRFGTFAAGTLQKFYFLVLAAAWVAQFMLGSGWMRLSVFTALVIAAVGLEAILYFREMNFRKASESPREKIRYGWFWGSLFVFLVAWSFWLLDARRIWCDPDNHFLSGHAAWHLINAFCFVGLARFYRQFPATPDSR